MYFQNTITLSLFSNPKKCMKRKFNKSSTRLRILFKLDKNKNSIVLSDVV